jgi:uncharacterized RDD family membrane protein YckC
MTMDKDPSFSLTPAPAHCRLSAWCWDQLPGVLSLLVFLQQTPSRTLVFHAGWPEDPLLGLGVTALFLDTSLLWQLAFLPTLGATPGMRLVGIGVVDEKGKVPTFFQSMWRWFGNGLTYTTLGFIWLQPLNQHRASTKSPGPGDELAGTSTLLVCPSPLILRLGGPALLSGLMAGGLLPHLMVRHADLVFPLLG